MTVFDIELKKSIRKFQLCLEYFFQINKKLVLINIVRI